MGRTKVRNSLTIWPRKWGPLNAERALYQKRLALRGNGQRSKSQLREMTGGAGVCRLARLPDTLGLPGWGFARNPPKILGTNEN